MRPALDNCRFVNRLIQSIGHMVLGLVAALALVGCTASESETGGAGVAKTPTHSGEPSADEAELAGSKLTNAGEDPGSAKPQAVRTPIYNEAADARADIKAALNRAVHGNKRVLVKFGGNWCGWCFKLHDVFKKNPEVASLLNSEYELVLVDVRSNKELLKELDPDNDRHGYPWLTVLDFDGNVLVNQNTEALEEGPAHDPKLVKAFLAKWQAEPLDAEQVLAASLEEARKENKLPFVHLGAPACGWCRVLDKFLADHWELFESDYVDVKIDTVRMTQGSEVAARVRKGSSGGIPWIAILDAGGGALVTSDGPQGNIGYPLRPHEIEHFVAMLHQTRQRMTVEQVEAIEQHLHEDAAKRVAVH